MRLYVASADQSFYSISGKGFEPLATLLWGFYRFLCHGGLVRLMSLSIIGFKKGNQDCFFCPFNYPP